ncbi:uncharacterized protein LOC6638240 isoform X2 [Drosophila willistoni]|uniref:uncharacterized protein LOC6638240 isoform X2 n=1 Tax=Drosophila willistoni TaxID=7260 RepID=UPI000C26D12F|nr:uncharacterized protein LOC6638240 isoform X2 [Drosophila willistoni]
MTRFEVGKIKGHYRNSTGHREADRDDNQTDYSENDCAQPSTPPQAEPPQCKPRGCPNSNVPRESGENIYVLRNCNECHDYTVRPCRKCNCPLRRRSAENPQLQSQNEAHLSEDSRLTEPSTSKPKEIHKINRRRSGGTCHDQVCQLCGQHNVAEATPPGGYEGMCIQCNSKIQNAMNTFYAQQAHQAGQPPWPNYQPAQPYVYQQAPMPNQWPNQVPSTADPTKEAPFNIIVLQDCHNNNALIDQLTNAISRIGTNPSSQGPRLSNNIYGHGGLIDYQYINYNEPPPPHPHDMYTRRSYQYDNYNDFQYAQNPTYQRPYPENPNGNHNQPKLENNDDEYQKDAPLKGESQQETCNLNSCPLKTNEPNDSNGCSCDCNYCRKGFETKERLAELIAQALEIFIMGTNAKSKPDHEKDAHKKEAKPKTKPAKAVARISKTKPKAVPIALSRSSSRENSIRSISREGSRISTKLASANSGASIRESLPRKSSKMFESVKSFQKKPTKERRSKRNRKHSQGRVKYRGGGGSANDPQDFLRRSNRDLLAGNTGSKTFFLPNCAKNQCKSGCGGRCAKPPHNCNSGCKGCCRASCAKSNMGSGGVGGAGGASGGGADGDGDNRTRPISSRHARCFQCNSGKPGHRQWHEYDADSCPMRQKDGGAGGGGKGRCCGGAGYMGRRVGGKSPSICAVTGLSRIAHYRPGMLNFPVNYIIDGIHSKRSSLVRTAAGVTLQQGPFLMTATHAPHLPRIPMHPNVNETKKQRRKWL